MTLIFVVRLGFPVWTLSFRYRCDEFSVQNAIIVTQAALTFFQLTTLDRWGNSVVRPLTVRGQDERPKIFYLRVFFILFIVISVMILLNLVMAIIVEKTFSLTKADEDQVLLHFQSASRKELQFFDQW